MTTFFGGPANGRTLELRRSPVFLRVVENDGVFDALDQLHDEPKRTEIISVYKLDGEVGRVHVYRSGGKGGWFTVAEYKFLPDQPADAEIRETEAWREWTRRAAERQNHE